MGPIVARLMREGFRRGVRDGSRAWRYVGATAAAVAVARWIFTEPGETVFESEVKPGQGIEIRTVPREAGGSSKKRKRARRR